MKNSVSRPPARDRIGLRAVGLALALICLGWTSAVCAAPSESVGLEYRIKAAFLYNFIKFVEWPPASFAGDRAPFIIGILDETTQCVSVVTEVLARKTTPSGRPIEVRLLSGSDEQLFQCHLLFVSRTAKANWPDTLKKVAGRPVLLVGERDGFAQHGGMMNLLVNGDAVRCEVNLRRAQRASLKLSGRLVNVARLVRDTDPEL